jgi:tRNA A-37 threonylcarbamoyl transferase component Bud32
MTKTASNSSDTEGKTVDDAMAGAGKISANHAELRLDDIEFVKLIKDDGFAETWVVHYQGKKWLHKTYRFRFWWGRMARPLARKWARNEMALCDALRGVPGTVSNYIKVSDQSFMREWVEGIDLGQRKLQGRVPGNAFFDELRSNVEKIHERGIAYNDLAKKYNVVVTEDDHPILIDYQISMRRYEGRNPIRRKINHSFIRYMQSEDLRHVVKLKRRNRPDLVTPEETAASYDLPKGGRTLRKWITQPARWIKRAIYPSGSNETFRFSKKYKQREKGYVQK